MKRRFYTDEICLIDDCSTPVYAKDLCNRHYQRLLKHGDPLIAGKYNFGEGKTFEQRFWSRVALTADDNRCWDWMAGTTKAMGYGSLTMDGKKIHAHRVSFFLMHGHPPMLNVLHSCDNPKCVNPKHLREGTVLENVADRVDRNRTALGRNNGKAKLDDADIPKIRTLLAQRIPPGSIGKRFGVSRNTIRSIASGQSWKHIPLEESHYE